MKINYRFNFAILWCYLIIIITWVQADTIRIPGLQWEKIDVVSSAGDDLPEERRDYAVGYSPDQDEIIIYGGRTVDDRVLSDTWIFNLNRRSWRKPLLVTKDSDTHPPSRYGMVYGNDQPPSNSYRNTFVITGGKGSDGQLYNDVWSFDFIRECWVEIKATGDIPDPRYDALGGVDLTRLSHLNQLSTVYFILSHGKNDSNYFKDTYILKLDGRSQQGDYSQLTAEWKKLNTKNAPELKDGATGAVLSSDRLVVFGGCEEAKGGNCNGKGYVLDVNFDYWRTEVESDASWKELSNQCIRPKAYAASARGSDHSIADVTDNDRLILFGGLTESKYGTDADGEISIFDMDKQKFFGVQPSSKSNEYPKATKGAKMITTSPKSAETDGFSIILYGGEPLTKDEAWSTSIWKLDVSNNYSYYPTPPEGVSMTECYTIQEVPKEEANGFDEPIGQRSTASSGKESIPSFILFLLTFMLAIPALVISSRALNCFTHQWKAIFWGLGALSFLLTLIHLITSSSSNSKNTSLLPIAKWVILALLLISFIFPFLRPKQPGFDFNQGEVNAAGLPISSPLETKSNRQRKEMKNSSSSTLLVESSLRDKANTAVSEINLNLDTESVHTTPVNSTLPSPLAGDKYRNGLDPKESFLSPIFIHPSVKEAASEDDEANEEDSTVSEIEDEEEVMKKKYLRHVKIWLWLLRGLGLLLLVGGVVVVGLTAYQDSSRLSGYKGLFYAWALLVLLLYVGAFIFARKKHTSMALLKAKRISFRPSDPLEPNPLPGWTNGLPPTPDPMKRFSLSETSAFDDIGNVSNYSQSVKNMNGAPPSSVLTTIATANAPGLSVSRGPNGPLDPATTTATTTTTTTTGFSIPPLPVTPVYMNQNGLFSVQPNYTYATTTTTNAMTTAPTVSPTSSMVPPSLDPTVHKATTSEITNLPLSTATSDYSSTYPEVQPFTTLPSVTASPVSRPQTSPSALVPSLALPSRGGVEEGHRVKSKTSHGSLATLSNGTVPSPQSQAQLLTNAAAPYFAARTRQGSHGSSSLMLEDPPIPVDGLMIGEGEESLDYPQRNNTIEDLNDKEVMMVMTVPKRKLAVVNL